MPDKRNLFPNRSPAAVAATILSLALLHCAPGVRNDTFVSDTPDAVNEKAPPPPSGVDFFSGDPSQVPYDVPGGAAASQTRLAVFAWQEFIALNYASNYDTTNYTRGEPDTSGSDQGLATFLTPDPEVPRVWQTYKHRVEIFPEDTTSYQSDFNSAPQYFYGDPILPLNDPDGTPLSQLTTYFNNLDEASEIDLCTLFVDGDPNAIGAQPAPPVASGVAGAPRRIIYQAKANSYMFDYIVSNDLYLESKRSALIASTATAVTQNGQGGLIAPEPGTLAFPAGSLSTNEGTIEVKASWRQLTWDEYQSGRFLTGPVIRYIADGSGDSTYQIIDSPSTPYTSQPTQVPYGVVGLHIIHKTDSFPTFVFATFEQVDNLNSESPQGPQPNNQLFYYNRNEGIASSGRQNVNRRAHPISDEVKQVNHLAHEQIMAQQADSVWQYYKLVGVQGASSNDQQDDDFFLANIVTETNEVLRSFSGTLDNTNGTIDPTQVNTYVGTQSYINGGCKGCHGNAQVAGADFSFITLNAPFPEVDVINQPLLKTAASGS